MKLYLVLVALFFASQINGQHKSASRAASPKLVVGIVVDQMRWDFLERYGSRYGQGGFLKMRNNGFSCDQTYIPYLPTYTAPGHACVFTGSVPAINGIISNNWYSRELKRYVYCAEDTSVQTVGSDSKAGMMSPVNMWTSTVGDELRLSSNFRSKVIGIGLKDRGAILPAGHSANAAFWFDDANGSFITSSYYMKALPSWLQAFNARRLPDSLMKTAWNTLYPIKSYVQSSKDEAFYEAKLPGGGNTFPHVLDTISSNRSHTFRYLPYANTYTVSMAIAAIEGERLGQGGGTDMLTISFSQPDYMGHTFGPNSIEAEDTYLRLDKDIADLLNYLDRKFGDDYLVFLTADHGVAHIPAFLKENKIPAGTNSDKHLKALLNLKVEASTGLNKAVLNISNCQVYLDYDVVPLTKRSEVSRIIMQVLLLEPTIGWVADLNNPADYRLVQDMQQRLLNGYNQKLSGDVQFIYKPGWFNGGSKGTTHGLWNPYDARIPLLWYGHGVRQGRSNKLVYMSDIAATVAAILNIQVPNGNVGRVIEDVLLK